MSWELPKKFCGTAFSVGPIIDALMTSNSAGNHQSLAFMLGSQNYKRINPRLSREIKLDDISVEAVTEMESLARGCEEDIRHCVKMWTSDLSRKFDMDESA